MFLSDVLNRIGVFPEDAFQERLYHEPLFFRGLSIGENASSIRLTRDTFWLNGASLMRDRRFRRLQVDLLYGAADAVDKAMSSPVYAEYRSALRQFFRERGLPTFMKVHRRHHFAFLGDSILDDPEFATHFDNIDYIVLDRRDRIAQTVSLYIAHFKNQVIVTEETLGRWHDGTIPYDEDALLALYDMLTLPERLRWRPFLRRALKHTDCRVEYIDHDCLIDDPVDTIWGSVSGQLGHDIDRNRIRAAVQSGELRPSNRPESLEFARCLREALDRRRPLTHESVGRRTLPKAASPTGL